MLDLYLHIDGAPFSTDPGEKNHLTGFSLEEFAELKRWQVIPDQLSFHHDSIWKSGIVGMFLEMTSDRLQKLKQTPGFRSSCLERFQDALQTAHNEDKGLLFICD